MNLKNLLIDSLFIFLHFYRNIYILIYELFNMIRGLKQKYFSGRSINNTNFDLNYVGQGIDQEGAGFYFTDDFNDAAYYAGDNGIIMECSLNPRKFVSNKAKPKSAEIRKLLNMTPNINEKLEDWDWNPTTAFKMVHDTIMDYEETQKDAFQQIERDFYYDCSKVYLENLIKMGYDGHFASIKTEAQHVIIYNPQVIKVNQIIKK